MQAFLIDLALKATVLVGVAAFTVALLRRQSAATRHLVWTLCLTSILALPLISWMLPAWRVPGVPTLARPSVSIHLEPEAAEQSAVADGSGPLQVAQGEAVSGGSARLQAAGSEALVGGSGRMRAGGSDLAAGTPTGSGRPQPPATAHSVPTALWIPAAWLGGVAVVLVTIGGGLARTRWLASRPGQVAGSRVQAAASGARERLGIARDVRVILADDQVMPMTWGTFNPVVLLPAESETWPLDRLRAVLMHEFAHVRRHDFATQLVARFAAALCWFHPLVWFGARQLRVERELACDDLVLAAGSRPSDYAQQLLDIARSLRPRSLTAVATVAMARPSQLAGRLLAVLDAKRARGGVTRGVVLAAVIIAAMVVVPVAGASVWGDEVEEGARGGRWTQEDGRARERADMAPSSDLFRRLPSSSVSSAQRGDDREAQACPWLTGEHTSASTNINDDRTRIRIEMDGCRIDVDVEGEVRFTDDFTDVARLARGGNFEIEERAGRDRRRVEIGPGDGGLTRRWWVNGDERAYDDEARAWLSRTLTVVFRRTGFQAKARADWIFRTRGLQGVLVEIDSIYSDYAAGRYYEVVLAQPNLDAATVQNLVRQAGARIDSDHTLGQILLAVAEHQSADENVRAAYVAAAQSIDSDFTKRRVLAAILKRPGLSPQVTAAMLQQAAEMDSDHEIGTLLRELIEAYPIDQSMTPAFFEAVNGIDSDFTRRSVLEALLEKGAPSQDVLDRTLESTSGMDSDHEIGRVLLRVAELYPVDQGLPASYVRAAQGLDSDFTQRQVWLALTQRQALPAATLAQVLDAAARMDSDHERGTVLRGALETHGVPAVARPAFFRAVGQLDSDFERGRVLRDVIDRKPVDRVTVLAAVEAGKGIDSDHELGRFLVHVTDNVEVDDELRTALRSAADAIESDHTRGQVLSALYPRVQQ